LKRIVFFFLIFCLILVACDPSDSETSDFEELSADEALDGLEEEGAEETDQNLTVDSYADTAVEMDEETAGTTTPTLDLESSDIPAEFTASNCPFDVPGSSDVECGYLTVPENRSLAKTPTIGLAVAIVYAPDSVAAEDNAPIVYLAGGPGGSALDDFAADPESWDYPFLQTRDLILIDQRGTGHSLPSLDCPEFQTAEEGENPDQLCFDRLVAEGIDLPAYNTRENAADVATLQEALGIPKWDLLGISYGTRLALEIMRNHPEGIRSVVLDSPLPPNVDMPIAEVYSMTDALSELFSDCERDAYCSEEYPDLEDVFLETVQRLNEDDSAEIFGDDLVFALSSAFSATSLIPLLPYVIYEVANDNFDALDEIAADSDTGHRAFQDQDLDFSDSEGMYNSVICYDEYMDGDYERAESAVVGTIPVELEGALLQSVFDLTQLCSYWNPMDAVSNAAVASDIPALVLSGQYDVATPLSWAEMTAATLSNSYLFMFPGAGHSLLSSVDCAIGITMDFLDNPTREPSNQCIDDIEWPYFE
jgi:pimeloyl-ACP methyl ester carboxylesterase